jgi:hypothetical protein
MTLLEHALEYARWGWSVFPLRPASKEPATEHGFKDATTDEAQIRKWWKKQPTANIGIATGRVSGLVVVDIDPRNGGDTAAFWRAANLDAVRLGTVITGSEGRHLYFRYPATGDVPTRSNFVTGIDLKSDGGYVVAPPSVHPNGVLYAWSE